MAEIDIIRTIAILKQPFEELDYKLSHGQNTCAEIISSTKEKEMKPMPFITLNFWSYVVTILTSKHEKTPKNVWTE